MIITDQLLDWLLEGDVAIQYQVQRDLLDEERPDLRARIATEGWGAQFLAARRPDVHWGRGFYQPKWISTHYTLLDLKHLGIAPGQPSRWNTLRALRVSKHFRDGTLSSILTT